MHIHDLIGIGFGPSNIALAIALEEGREARPQGRPLDALFVERQPGFVWHKNMLLDHAHMQISFLKDLATLRNPSSRFTFLNYLHEKERLQDFINLKTFFPSRHEFNDYLGWAAAQFEDRCAYGEDVFEVLPEPRGGEVKLLRVRSRTAAGVVQERLTRHLVVGVGGMPRIPAEFKAFKDDPRVFHSSNYLQAIAGNGEARRIAVVGAGQSAAEIFMDLHGRPQRPHVDLVMRARSIKPSDDSPFVNEIFNADFTDFVFSRTGSEREELLNEYWHTNYAAPDLALIQQIFDVFYRQRVSGEERHRFLRRHEVAGAQSAEDGLRLTLRDLNHERTTTQRYDAIVLATGYERDRHRTLLSSLQPYLGNFEVDRHYRLRGSPNFHPSVFLQGACELTHGLSDTLLSVTAIRSGEIRSALHGAAGLSPAAARQESSRQAA
ncbi:lysine N(6)-hydroxylase/L-ornithine N(5)-oxygenase family protein [Roseateles chitinivorans]|uniref:lysine N(6)-hydroxylase/L-ornithine N(5)-oxygenase family protein n=1 Tax=Roseateles chitinivorans TaxID=2917965 RepID=UPI003D66912B